MSDVFVVDGREPSRQPCVPVHPGRARFLVRAHPAAVLRRFPFTLVLTAPPGPPEPAERRPAAAAPGSAPAMETVEEAPAPLLRLKRDPGSKTTGLALLGEAMGQGRVLWTAELSHRA